MFKVKCLNCGGRLVRENDLRVVCIDCGLVIDDTEDERWLNQSLIPRSYNVPKTYSSPEVSNERRAVNLQYIRLLERASRTLSVPTFVKQTTIRLFMKYVRNNNTIREKRYILASCFLISVREIFKLNIKINDVVCVFNCSKGKLIRHIYKVSKYFNLKIKPLKVNECITWAINIIYSNVEFIKILKERRVESECYFKKMEKLIDDILYSFRIINLQGHNPYVLAASVIYCADKMLSKIEGRKSILTLNTISKLLGISRYSIRDNYKLIARRILLRALA